MVSNETSTVQVGRPSTVLSTGVPQRFIFFGVISVTWPEVMLARSSGKAPLPSRAGLPVSSTPPETLMVGGSAAERLRAHCARSVSTRAMAHLR